MPGRAAVADGGHPGVPEAVSGGAAALGLFAQAAASMVSRWWAGCRGDRHGHAGLLVPGLLTAAGMTILIWVAAPVALIAGMSLFGIGFGIRPAGISHRAGGARVPLSGPGLRAQAAAFPGAVDKAPSHVPGKANYLRAKELVMRARCGS